MVAWLSLEAVRIWLEHGPAGPAPSRCGAATTPATWLEPIESGLHVIRRAREGLAAAGELTMVGYTYHKAVYYLL